MTICHWQSDPTDPRLIMSRVFTPDQQYCQPSVLLIPGGSRLYIISFSHLPLTGQTRQANNFSLTISSVSLQWPERVSRHYWSINHLVDANNAQCSAVQCKVWRMRVRPRLAAESWRRSECKVLSNYPTVRSDGLAGITVCGELASSDSSVIKIGRPDTL